ncbi:MAG: stage III sporulation protein AE [Christensenellales bacterium]|nr:stage III sporulation protein AE [Christensenellales bacterium]
MKCAGLVLLVLICMLPTQACAREDEMQAEIRGVVEGLDFSGIEGAALPDWFGYTDVREAVLGLASGETLSVDGVLSGVLGAFGEAVRVLGRTMIALMLPVLLVSVLLHTIGAQKGALAPLSRSMCFVLILIPVMLLVFSELAHTRETITAMTDRMDKLLPMLLTLLTALGGSASSAFLHPMVVAASGSMVFLAREVILRLVMCTCAVTAINHLSDRAHLTRLAQLLRGAVCWLLGVSFTVFLGAMSLQGVCSASIDGVVIRAAKYAVDNFVPVVGGMFSDTMDTLVGCTLIVKNALGVAAVMVLLDAVLGPLARTLAAVFLMKLSAALMEPVADAQIVHAIGDFSRTIVLFLITMLCVGTMYFLLIVQLLLVGNLTVMLR